MGKLARRRDGLDPQPAREAPGVTLSGAEDVARVAEELYVEGPDTAALDALVRGPALLRVDGLVAGYGPVEILHGVSLRVGKGQSLCLIGPNGAGKSTVLHSIYGLADIRSGSIAVRDRDITSLRATEKLERAGMAYILQDNSVFPDMTVEENLLMGGYLLPNRHEARHATDRVLERYPRLAERRRQDAGVLSGGERRLLEISRALIMDPSVLLVDEPSIGLEPRYIDMVFEILADLQRTERKTIIMVEQNAKKGLEFADLGYVLVAGRIALAGHGRTLLADPEVGRLFLGG